LVATNFNGEELYGDFYEVFPQKLLLASLKLVNTGAVFEFASVNNSNRQSANRAYLLGVVGYSQTIHTRFSVNKLCISIRLRNEDSSYDVHSSLKELRRTAAVNRLKLEVSRIIPGNWGKAESGWLARPLLSRIARFGSGGRIHQFL
jgi:hypothetical protein